MWLITTIGFYSIVGDREDSDRTLIRARVRGDLETLRDRHIPELEIFEAAGADYRWRASVARRDLERAVAVMAADIDYPNFKNAVAERQGARRAHLYGDVWSVLQELQKGEHGRP